MNLRRWEDLPEELQTPEVKKYYDILIRKRPELAWKRVFDVCASSVLMVILSPVMLVVAFAIRKDSPGPVIYRQVRVTRYGREFDIYKFRSMTVSKEKGAELTVGEDERITKVGKVIRKYRIDEFPQLLNVFKGDMSFVGTRPEVPKYVRHYTPEMKATLLQRAGITSNASIKYKEESDELNRAEDPIRYYIEKILPEKMKYNLEDIKKFSLARDVEILFKTVFSR